ncbi:LLM class flavin-dependent oxidoreductase [Niallia sp. 03133]|uniref:LLM class flavin-dependent oxidoreductase n=1 Tax=Niallia sp. 03133 TaxID=3458060 RepID=UPI004044AC47
MKLSILDQSPISSNQTAQEALQYSMKLAQAGEAFGYTRYWIAEHHDLSGLACSAPEVMLSYIGAHTTKIRIGAGAVLLPYYRPYKVAEQFNTLATLFPGRIDIGIGRAPGGSAEASNALTDNFLQQIWAMPNLVEELLHFIENDFPADHMFAKLSASPLPEISPMLWMLGTSKKSALLAGSKGLAYSFGQFMSDKDGAEIIQQYRDAFISKKKGEQAQVILTVSAICAETTEKAEEIAQSSLIWSLQRLEGKGEQGVPSKQEAKEYGLNDQQKEKLEKMKEKMIIGNPKEVRGKLESMQAHYKADEIMITTVAHNPDERIYSYQLIAEKLLI